MRGRSEGGKSVGSTASHWLMFIFPAIKRSSEFGQRDWINGFLTCVIFAANPGKDTGWFRVSLERNAGARYCKTLNRLGYLFAVFQWSQPEAERQRGKAWFTMYSTANVTWCSCV